MDLYSTDSKTLASLLEVVDAGVIVYDIHTHRRVEMLCTNRAFRSAYRMKSTETPPSLPLPLVRAFDEHALLCARQRTPTGFEHPLDDEDRWHHVCMIPVLSEHDKRVRVFATATDITATRHLEQDLRTAHARLSAIIDASHEGIVTVDAEQHIMSFNQTATRIFGYEAEEVAGQPLEILIPERFRDRHPAYVLQFRDSDDTSRSMESRVEVCGRRKDGSVFAAEITIAKISVGNGIEFTAFVRDISEHMRLLDELYIRASTDSLTGLYNRRHTLDEADKELARAKRFSHPVALLLIDLDDFKSINDTYGHHIGDLVLQRAAGICTHQARQSDIVARWGGEEFLLLLPETDMDGGMHMGERILDELHELHVGVPHLGDRRITASIGVAVIGDGAEDSFEMMAYRADQAMYAAKNSGKDRIIQG